MALRWGRVAFCLFSSPFLHIVDEKRGPHLVNIEENISASSSG